MFSASSAGDNLLLQQIEEVLAIQAAHQHTVLRHGDDSRFLADDDDNGVGVFAHAKAGAMAAHVLAHFQVVGQRQHAAGSYVDAVADDDRAVMQGVPS